MFTHLKLLVAIVRHNFKWVNIQPFQVWIYHCICIHYKPRIAVSTRSGWRRLKWVANEKNILLSNEKNILLSLKMFRENFRSKTSMCRKLSHSSEMKNDALMHREGLTLSRVNLPLSSSSTTSRELLSQFSTCSGWRWLNVDEKVKKIAMYCQTNFMEILIVKPSVVGKLSLFSGM